MKIYICKNEIVIIMLQMTPARNLKRHRYLALLRKIQTATAGELARALNVTPANVRYHLTGLQADGLVQVVEIQPSEGRGRPVKIYGLSRSVQGDNLTQLADVIMTDWLKLIDGELVGDAMERVARSMMDGSQSVATGNIARKLVNAMDHLNRMRYQARWEAHAAGPRVIFEFCPYASVISRHPELCLMDAKLLQEYLGGEIEQLAKREKGFKNIPVCIFAVKEYS
jgi:predicted ArsR family transcriptional regulator